MTKRLMGLAMGMGVAVLASSVWAACPDEKHTEGTHVQKVSDDHQNAPCSAKKEASVSTETSPCANCPGCKNCKGGCKKATTVADASESNEKIEAVLAKLPKITYQVGEERTCCRQSAGMLAEKSGKPLQYVVGDEVVSDEAEAVVKLAAVLEKELESMTSVQYAVAGDCMKCPVTAKKVAAEKNAKLAYRIAGFDVENKEQAEKAAKLASEAAQTVKLTYKVDGASFCCNQMAGAKAKETGKPMTYVVGDQETPCDKHAQLLLMQAKIRAIVAAAATAIVL